MKLIFCVDDSLGLRFNHRRQSRDRVVSGRIAGLCGGELWLHPDSRELFPEDLTLHEVECPEAVPQGAWCFWEEPIPETLEPERILLYRWHRDYPGDEFFAFPGGSESWVRTRQAEFKGHSHPEMTEELFEKKE